MAGSKTVSTDEVLGGTVVRRVLLFQVDLETPEAALAFGNAVGDAGIGKADIRLNQPDDYDSPSSTLYWRNVLKKFNKNPGEDGYKSEYKRIFQAFIQNLFQSIDLLELKKSRSMDGVTSAPFVEISDLLVGGLDNYNCVLDQTNNTLNLNLIHPTLVKDRSFADLDLASQLFETINPRENDVVMVRTSYNGGPFKLEFIGQLVNVNPSYRYGSLIRLGMEVAGLSKSLYTSQIISKRALSVEQFLPNIEINSVADVTPFDGRFNPKTARAIFKEILSEAMLAAPLNQQITPGTDLYTLNKAFFNSGQPQGFQFDFFLFLTLYIMSKTQAVGDLWAQLGPDATPMLLDQDIRAIQEAGDYRVFNLAVARGFSSFFSNLEFPYEVLDEIRNNTFMDVFEARNGMVISRPPRYNRIDLPTTTTTRLLGSVVDDYNVSRISADADKGTLQRVFKALPSIGWSYNPDADFFIKSDDLVGDIELMADEMEVETRIDTKWSIQLNQPQEIAAGSWTDPTLLVRYGFRSKAPVSNPNVLNPRAARLFAPIALAWANAKTRQVRVSVRDNRIYYVGRLYYIEALNMVAYLVGENIKHVYEGVSQRSLTFSMFRKVVSRGMNDILSSEDELLNFALCYCKDITPDDLKDTAKAKENIRARGRQLLADMEELYSQTLGATTVPSPGNPGFTVPVALDNRGNQVPVSFTPQPASQRPSMLVPMFKYLPSILDMIVEVELDKTLGEVPDTPSDNSSLRRTQNNGEGNEVAYRDREGRLYATFRLYGFPQMFDKFGELVSSPKRDSFLDADATIPAGAVLYGPTTPLRFMQINPSKSTPKENAYEGVLALKTPFVDSHFVESTSKFSVRQLLINMMVNLDLLLKFKTIGGFFVADAPGGEVPQFFVYGPDGYELFYTGSSLVGFSVGKLSAKWEDAVVPNYNLKDLSGNSLPANILRLKLDSNNMPYLENKYYEIKPNAAGEYNLPMGYFVTYNFAVGWQFFSIVRDNDRTMGGRVRKVSVFNQKNVMFEAVDQALNFQLLPLRSDGDYGIYFVTPYAEPTIERLMELNLPPSKAGQYTAKDVNSLKKQVKADRPSAVLLEENQKHIQGKAIDVSPDYLVAASRSDLVMKGSAAWNAGTGPEPELVKVFQDRLVRAGFVLASPPNTNTPAPTDPKRRSFFFAIKSAMTAAVTYPQGSSAGSKALAFFHLEVSDADISSFKRWLLPPREGNENLYAPSARRELPSAVPEDAVAPGSPQAPQGGING